MTRQVETVAPDASLKQAAMAMEAMGVGSLPVRQGRIFYDGADVTNHTPRQLIGAVVAITRLRIGLPRLEQADLVIEAQLPRRHAGDPGEIADPEHRVSTPAPG